MAFHFNMNLQDKVRKVVTPELHKEALTILALARDKHREQFEHYFDKGQWNTCCSVIDFAKYELVKTGVLKREDFKNWGEYLFDLLD